MSVEGLIYEDNFVSEQDEKVMIEFINSREWSNKLSRRTQHYGFEYSYDRKNTITQASPIPEQFNFLVEKLNKKFGKKFNQLIINEYQCGQGISPHIDNTTLFGDTIVSISLGCSYPMIFSKGEDSLSVILKNRSLAGDARYKWKHSISSKKYDNKVREYD
jgi:alkylated DNA repair dioxygenase AlkB